MNILCINTGSTSLKYEVFDQNHVSTLKGEFGSNDILDRLIEELVDNSMQINDFDVVVHRIVHGGGQYIKPTHITDDVLNNLKELNHLAPLHNPPALKVVEEIFRRYPDTIQYAVFDTAFHDTKKEVAKYYGLPLELQKDLKIQRYGFHGISHNYISDFIRKQYGEDQKIISCHLGGGCSICAIADGKSVDTTMGFGPEEGLIMGTRCGDLGAAVVLYLIRKGYNPDQIENILNQESGLLGLSGVSFDLQDLEKIKKILK
ncbi:hypothetical protein HC864_00230 [Candidatus Gracilibacteria bacterium]|nr:hypothetical protein [Thermales bacterium]NJL96250.1 hypothetical protein [Candidatus Gracilibacteria bacterium]